MCECINYLEIEQHRYKTFGVSIGVRHKAGRTAKEGGFGLEILDLERLYYLCCENKCADQLHGKLIYAFVFTYAKSRFSHDAAHTVYAAYYRATDQT